MERQEENEEHDSRTKSVSVSVTVMIAARQIYTFASDCGHGELLLSPLNSSGNGLRTQQQLSMCIFLAFHHQNL